MTALPEPRSLSGALDLLREYGAEVPEALTAVRTRLREIRALQPDNVDPFTRGAAVLADPDPVRRLAREAKAAAEARERSGVLEKVRELAFREASAASLAAADEILEALLASPCLRQAFDVIVETAPRIPAATPLTPSAEVVGFDVVADVAHTRKAMRVFETITGKLAAVGLLADVSERSVGLLYADVSGVAYREADRALRGVRPGALDVNVFQRRSVAEVPAITPYSEQGITPAILAHAGASFSLATSAAEWRGRAMKLAAKRPPGAVEQTPASPFGVIW